MRVLYDITNLGHIHCAEGVNSAGIFRATEQLGRAIAADDRVDLRLSASPAQFAKAERYLRETGAFDLDRLVVAVPGGGGIVPVTALRGSGRDADAAAYVAANYTPELVASAGRFDLRHVNWRGLDRFPDFDQTPIVAPVFDVIALKHPEWFVERGSPNPIGDHLAAFIGSAGARHHLVTNTEAVRQDVLNRFSNVSPEQVHVVPLGASSVFHPDVDAEAISSARSRYGIPDGMRYVLCVNTLEPRKNMETAVEAYEHLCRSGGFDDVALVLVGSKGWLSGDLDTASSSRSGTVIVTGFVADDDLAAVYAGASAFLYPSLDEGFGLPVLEAMNCGVPVVCSDRRPLLEVAGDAALSVAPRDFEAMAEALSAVLSSAEVADGMRSAGIDRALRFTWESAAEAAIGVYEHVVDARATPSHLSYPTSTASPAVAADSLAELAGAFSGERLVIIAGDANGPIPFAMFEDEYTMVVDEVPMPHPAPVWKPTFHLATEAFLKRDMAGAVNGWTGSLFLTEESVLEHRRDHGDVVPVVIDQIGRVDGVDLVGDVLTEPSTFDRSVLVAVQIAAYLGFDIVLACPPLDTRTVDMDLHMAVRDACDSAGISIVNICRGTYPNVYRRAEPHTLFASASLPEFDRLAHAELDETQIISTMLHGSAAMPRVMLDVGAHRGTSARHFAGKGWKIFCFEPDPSNRSHLIGRLGDRDDVIIDTRAVGAESAAGVPFFSSPESTGISGLSAFRESHEESGRVDITTVEEILDQHGLETIDFLKIDVEGHDFDVLRGVPWDRVRPMVIECEYEDAKTLPMGHETDDIVTFLRDRGYAVYLSEWHPIIRYGVAHDWRRVLPVPGADVPSNSWGNLIAFRRDPGFVEVQRAFAAQVKLNPGRVDADSSRSSAPPTSAVPTKAAAVQAVRKAVRTPEAGKRRFYADRADRLRSSNPRAYRALRTVRRFAARLMRRPRVLALLIVLAVGTLAAGAFLPLGLRTLLWSAAAFGAVSSIVAGLTVYTRRTRILQEKLAARISGLERQSRDLAAIHARDHARALSLVEAKHTDLAGVLDSRVVRLDGTVVAVSKQVADLDSRADAAEGALAAVRKDGRALRDQLAQNRRDWETAHGDVLRRSEGSHDLAVAMGRVLRTDLDVVAGLVSRPSPPVPVTAETGVDPLLTIAIPAYQRPQALETCLTSITEQIVDEGRQDVEVLVVDDASPDPTVARIAAQFATTHKFVGYRANPVNIGLERNLLNCLSEARGSFSWILGADDVVRPGGLAMVCADILTEDAEVFLYDKRRFASSGNAVPNTTGSFPEIADGDRKRFGRLLDVAAESGIVSGFGFVSTLVFASGRIRSVDPERYFGLTMYPQLGVLLETSAFDPVVAHRVPIVDQRTQTPAEKFAEAIGRREENFMSVETDRNPRWFGATYAALLQRVVDRTELTVRDLLLPERIFGQSNMLTWIHRNNMAAAEAGIEFAPDVSLDAKRFFETVRSNFGD